ncbi:MAG TPA: DUF3332 family protein [Planctomycetota bacterium]|nr:DUF3332 family protein [Planctomycetota bacterium]
MKKNALVALALACCLSSTSCVGPNHMYNGLASWNTRVSDSKWINEVLYVCLWAIPVYPITFTLDALIFNAFEFWGGENPIGEPADFETQAKK